MARKREPYPRVRPPSRRNRSPRAECAETASNRTAVSVDEGPESPHTPITGRGRRRAGELAFFAMFGSLCFSYTGQLIMFFYKVLMNVLMINKNNALIARCRRCSPERGGTTFPRPGVRRGVASVYTNQRLVFKFSLNAQLPPNT